MISDLSALFALSIVSLFLYNSGMDAVFVTNQVLRMSSRSLGPVAVIHAKTVHMSTKTLDVHCFRLHHSWVLLRKVFEPRQERCHRHSFHSSNLDSAFW